jgi:DNA invertase Pin-like site-specific DNA recombinase
LIKKVPFCKKVIGMTKYGYVRTSTPAQLIDRQINRLKDECEHVYIECGVSAVKRSRPVYQEVVSQLQPGDVFIVLSLDRAFRSGLDALKELDKLHSRDVAFRSLTQNFDTRTPEGKLFFSICAALAEFERGILSNRTKEGMEAARRRGKRIGRPRKLKPQQITWARSQLKHSQDSKLIGQLSKTLNVSQQTLQRALDK